MTDDELISVNQLHDAALCGAVLHARKSTFAKTYCSQTCSRSLFSSKCFKKKKKKKQKQKKRKEKRESWTTHVQDVLNL